MVIIVAGLLGAGLTGASHEGKRDATPAGRTTASERISEDWFGRATEEIRLSEYHFSLQDDGSWWAPNRAHDLRSRLDTSGVQVISRTKGADIQEGGWELHLALRSYGREGDLNVVLPAHAEASGPRATYRRGPITEWYVNDERGLEQGFTIDAALPSPGDPDSPLVLEMSLSGTLSGFLSGDSRSVSFRSNSGQESLRYHELKVYDARASELDARLAVIPDGLRIVIADRDAVYPLTIDPLLTTAQTVEPDAKNSSFGFSVATAGNVNGDAWSDVIIGAPKFDGGQTDEGRVFVYHGTASGLPTTVAWTAESNQACSCQNGTKAAEFGTSVGTAGDVNGDGYSDVIIGAPYWDEDSIEQDAGRVFVWYGGSGGLGDMGNGTPMNADWQVGPAFDKLLAYFGYSVGTAGDVNGDGYSDVIIGAHQQNNAQVREGMAHVFHGSSTGLPNPAEPAWTGEGNQSGSFLREALFGYSVGTAGDVNGDGYSDIIVGAVYYDNGTEDEGRVFVYHGSTNGLPEGEFAWAWAAESDQAGAPLFGSSVGTAGDVNGDGYSDVIVGAPNYDNPESNEGAAFVWYGGGSGLGPQGNPGNADWIRDGGNQQDAGFGASVGTAGDVDGDGFGDVIVGSPYWESIGTQSEEGRAWVFEGAASGLSTTPVWTQESNYSGARFGFSAATAGDIDGDGFSDVIVGSYQWESGSNHVDEGRAWVYRGSLAGLGTTSGWIGEGDNQAGSRFGVVASAGDVNGDGFSDLIIGAPGFDAAFNDEGRVFMYHGSPSGPVAASWTAVGGQAGAGFGLSVASAGDVNGDGYGDVIIGALGFDNPEIDEGRVFVYLGDAAGLGSSPAWTAQSDQAGAWLGYAIGTAGDVNGDGFSDVIVSAPRYDGDQVLEGKVFIWYGGTDDLGADGTPSNADWSAESNVGPPAFSPWFGSSAGTAGDVNRDGFSDIIVGAVDYASSAGRAFVWLGSESGLNSGVNGTPANAAWIADSNQSGALLGYSAATAGDVNGDGYSDVIVGAPLYSFGLNGFSGKAFVWYGGSGDLGANGTPNNADWIAESNQNGNYFGSGVASAGDVNGDGFSDVLVGAHLHNNPESDEGRAFLWLGSSTGLPGGTGTPLNAAWSVESNQADAHLGYFRGLKPAGDVNGDGFGDVIVGAEDYDDGSSVNEGRAWLYYGNVGSNGAPGKPRAPMQIRSAGVVPISPLGKSDSSGGFRLRVIGRTPAGRGKVRLQWEVKPLATAFDGLGLGQGSIVDTGSPGPEGSFVTLEENVTGLAAGTVYKWRVRILWTTPGIGTLPSNPFHMQRSPWFTLPHNNVTEADLRTAP
jgi:hypothetical protein